MAGQSEVLVSGPVLIAVYIVHKVWGVKLGNEECGAGKKSMAKRKRTSSPPVNISAELRSSLHQDTEPYPSSSQHGGLRRAVPVQAPQQESWNIPSSAR